MHRSNKFFIQIYRGINFELTVDAKKKKKKKKVNFRSSVRAFPFSFLINAREPRVFRNPG